MSGERRAISTEAAPAAVGPYSQAIEANGLVFVSGQLGLAVDGSGLVAGGVEAEARQAFANLSAIAEAAGVVLGDALKVTVLLTDIAAFAAVNEVCADCFPGGSPPARVTCEVSALPLGAQVEIDAIFPAGG